MECCGTDREPTEMKGIRVDQQVRRFERLFNKSVSAAEGDSNDAEIKALGDAIDAGMGLLQEHSSVPTALQQIVDDGYEIAGGRLQ